MKKINVTRSFIPNFFEFAIKMHSLWSTRHLTNYGYYHNLFEKNLKQYLSNENLVLFSNGHLALESALRISDLKGRVITTPFTFPSTVHAITRLNLEPVFCDINNDDFTIDTNKIEDLIDETVTAILAVHVYGNICNIEKLEVIARKHNLKLIIDAAHSFGITLNNKSISHYGDISMFSFHAAKVFHSVEGGMLSFRDDNLINKFKLDQNFGIQNYNEVLSNGGNAKMNEFQALMGLLNLKKIDKEIKLRRSKARRYSQLLNGIDGVRIVTSTENVESNYSYFVIQILNIRKSRDTLNKLLNDAGFGSRRYFYPLATDYECYKNENFYGQNFEVASSVVTSVLALPLYGALSNKHIKAISRIIIGYLQD